ncbi:MAG TPA: alpha/beta hydrolase [Gaiellaceae bacterium]
MTRVPNTRYATTDDGVTIAYQIVGDGPVDLVLELESWGNVEIMWELDALADLFERLSQFSRLVLHDRRATGLSGGVSFPNLETRARDLLAVLDAIRSPRAVLFGERTAGRRPHRLRSQLSQPSRLARVEQGGRDEAVVARLSVGPDAGRASRGGC